MDTPLVKCHLVSSDNPTSRACIPRPGGPSRPPGTHRHRGADWRWQTWTPVQYTHPCTIHCMVFPAWWAWTCILASFLASWVTLDIPGCLPSTSYLFIINRILLFFKLELYLQLFWVSSSLTVDLLSLHNDMSQFVILNHIYLSLSH